MNNAQPERGKVGAPKRFGERKPMLTRLEPALALEFESYCAAAKGGPISVTEGLQRLVEEFCKRKRELLNGKSPTRPVEAGPAPRSVTITALTSMADTEHPVSELPPPRPIAKPPPTNKASPWVAIQAKLRGIIGQEVFDQGPVGLEFVSFENCKLTITAPSPWHVDDTAERFSDLLGEIASELTGEAVSVVVGLAPVFAERERQEDERKRRMVEAREKEEAERPKKIARLKELYQTQTPKSAKEAEAILLADETLLGSLAPFVRKQIEQWLSGGIAGASYQQAKEDAYRGPRKGGR